MHGGKPKKCESFWHIHIRFLIQSVPLWNGWRISKESKKYLSYHMKITFTVFPFWIYKL